MSSNLNSSTDTLRSQCLYSEILTSPLWQPKNSNKKSQRKMLIYRIWILVWISAKTSVTLKMTRTLISAKHFAMLRMHPRIQIWIIHRQMLRILVPILTPTFIRTNTARDINGTKEKVQICRILLRRMLKRISVGRKVTTTTDTYVIKALWGTLRSLPPIAARHTLPTPTSGTSVSSMTLRKVFIFILNPP